ncbi:MAG: 50S ribosomal protein L40e [Candidatus Aenigmarchaeota archaeon]|nr:50S ribosomal protein L40e [Candidatus Aenigmarchaeota archaeon]
MAKKLPEFVAKRLYENMFVCMRCNAKLRTTPQRVKAKKAKCRKCGSKSLRLKAKERRGAKV